MAHIRMRRRRDGLIHMNKEEIANELLHSDAFKHFGKKGMKWGVRKAEKKAARAAAKAEKYAQKNPNAEMMKLRKVARKAPHKLTTADMAKLTDYLRVENEVRAQLSRGLAEESRASIDKTRSKKEKVELVKSVIDIKNTGPIIVKMVAAKKKK